MERDTFNSEFLGAHERGDKHDTFSSEFQGAPEARDSFSSEFRGVPEPTFGDERPSGTFDHGRKPRRVIAGIVVALALVGGGTWAIWYWSDPLAAWLDGLGGDDKPVEPATEVEPAPAPAPELEPPPPAEPPVDKVFGIKGTPEGGDSGPVPEPMPVDEPTTDSGTGPNTPPPLPAPASVETLATQVKGKVSGARVGSHLDAVETALRGCWTASAGKLGNIELTLRFTIKWNGKAHAVSVTGGDEALQRCVKEALPISGWPQPSDGGEATIVRRWRLAA